MSIPCEISFATFGFFRSARARRPPSASLSLPRARSLYSLLVLHVFTCSALLSCVSVSVCPGLTKAVGGGAPPAPLAARGPAARPLAHKPHLAHGQPPCCKPARMRHLRSHTPSAIPEAHPPHERPHTCMLHAQPVPPTPIAQSAKTWPRLAAHPRKCCWMGGRGPPCVEYAP